MEAFDALSIPDSIQLGAINAIKFISHSEHEIQPCPAPLARIVDRAALDRVIARRAEAAGANIHVSARIADLTLRDKVIAQRSESNGEPSTGINTRRIVEARMAILATGPRDQFHGGLGMGVESIDQVTIEKLDGEWYRITISRGRKGIFTRASSSLRTKVSSWDLRVSSLDQIKIGSVLGAAAAMGINRSDS